MPAKNVLRIAEGGTYSHVYNRGIEKRIIFKDKKDYEVFLGYLKDYLTPARDPKSAKKEFTVNGRIFRGIPHQPKNYFNQVELVAYNLMPSHFHLLLHQVNEGAIEKFMRSLSTRYSMYFNKKYKRTGTLFQGPYKSVQIKDVSPLLLLTRYMHQGKSEIYSSSYPEYLGQRKTSWIRSEVVLSLKGAENYKNFVEKYELTEKENEALEGIILERRSEHLEGRDPELAGSQILPDFKESGPVSTSQQIKSRPRIPELVASAAVFMVLVGLGVRNINAYSNLNSDTSFASPAPTSEPTVSGTEDERPITEEVIGPITIARIKITDGAASVNIRREPSIASEKIGEALEGDTFKEFKTVDPKWYEVKLSDGSIGYISSRYIVEETEVQEQ